MTYNIYLHNLQFSDSKGLLFTDHRSTWKQSQPLYYHQNYCYVMHFIGSSLPCLYWTIGLMGHGVQLLRRFQSYRSSSLCHSRGKTVLQLYLHLWCEKALGQHSFQEYQEEFKYISFHFTLQFYECVINHPIYSYAHIHTYIPWVYKELLQNLEA